MRTLAVALCFTLIMTAAALSDEPDPSQVLREIQPQRDLWLKCTAGVARTHLRGRRGAAGIADAALARCSSQESRLRDVLKRRLGKASSDRIMEFVRETDRSNLIRVIEMLRGN
jgi:hypothetical protein